MSMFFNQNRKHLHKSELVSRRICWGYQHGCRSFVYGHQHGRRDVTWKHSTACWRVNRYVIDKKILTKGTRKGIDEERLDWNQTKKTEFLFQDKCKRIVCRQIDDLGNFLHCSFKAKWTWKRYFQLSIIHRQTIDVESFKYQRTAAVDLLFFPKFFCFYRHELFVCLIWWEGSWTRC